MDGTKRTPRSPERLGVRDDEQAAHARESFDLADQPAASLDHDQMVRLIAGRAVADLDVEIGRASCRERVYACV